MTKQLSIQKVLAALLTIAALATGQTAWAWDGSGTSDSPWLIKTTYDLVALADNSASNTYYGKFFRLENDLDMNGVAIGTIGGNSKRFRGTFDGNGHAIRNLTINKPGDDHVGLFGIISANSTIRNLIIDGANITGNNYVGVIFGRTVDGGTIENCLVVNSSVTVTSSTGTYGGIISGCYLDNLTFSGNYYYNCSVTMGSNAPVTTNIATTGGDIDGAAIADATATVSLPDAWVTFGANQFLVGGYYYNGTIYYDSSIGYTVGPATWAALQTAFNNASTDAEHPTELTLAADITASASDSYLNLTGGRKVILDLNGHTLSRGLTAATTDGYVIRVIGTNTSLTIRDGATGGTITGGWSNSGPGCISVTSNATLRLESGTISGNRVNRSGGTISITGGTVYITGGTITGNWANIETWNNNSFASCGAIYFNEGGTLYMSGGAITGNRCRTTTLGAAGIGASLMLSHRVHLSGSYNISGNEQGDYDEATGEWSNLTPSDILNNNRTLYILDGPINPVAPAHMILDHDGSSATFTSGWATHMGSTDPEQCFTLDPATGKGLGIVDGEVHVGTLHTLTLADGLTASVTQAAQGKSVTLSGAAAPVTTGGITYTTDYIVSYNDGTNDHVDHYTADDQGNATFVMPDANVTVSTETVASVTYIDADGTERTITDFTIVSSSYEFGDNFGTALLGVDDYIERWYAVVGTVSLDKRLSVEGNARLILCDAAALIVNADYDCGTAFDFSYNGLTIYGQAQGTGTLSVTNTGGAIHVSNNITINGGTVIATSTDIFEGIFIHNGRTLTINRGTLTASGGNGININGTLTQNGGTLSATGAYGISIDEGTLTLNGGTLNATGSGTNYAGIYATYDATVNILGGTLNATGTADAYGIYATGDGTTVTLGWTTPDDRITASSYSGTVKIADGKALKNGGTVYYGTLTAAQKSAIANVTLQPATQAEFIAAALPQTGTNEYTIYDSVGWNAFCLALDDNATWNRFSGDTVKLGADITVTRMAGSSHCDFCGIFDGQGHTLTVNIHSDNEHEYTAPFSYISETTPTGGSEVSHPAIRNLNVAGTVTATKDYVGGIVGAFWGTLTIENCSSSVTINTNNKHAAGFIGYAAGNATITNCLSSVTINSSVSGDGTHAGFIGGSHSGTTFTIEGCAFTGSLLTTNGTTHCAGFVGYNSGTLTISNSLFAPASVTVSDDNSATFARNGATITNCYYTRTLGTAQGKQARSITADNYVTVENAGPATTYSTSGITSYGTGILYDNVLYAGNGDVVSLTLSNSIGGDVPEGYQYAYSTNAGTLDGSRLTMPNADVIVSAALRSTGQPVDGIGYYINNEYRFWEAIALDGTESSLGISGKEKWYFVGTDISHSGTILCSGNVNIILAYGKTMTITSSDGDGIDVNGSLTIYGQDYITGTLNVNGYYTGINSYSGNITISGGTVNATGNYTGGIYSSGNITISDSRVTATGGSYGIRSNSGNITIGCAYASDFIYASSYVVGSEGTLNIADGKAFKDVDGNPYRGTIYQVNEAYPIDGKRLYPDCVVMKHITGYGNSTESDHWVFIASPVVDNIAPSEVHNLFPSAGETSNDYDLYRFNQSSSNGKEWQNWKATTTENHPDFTSLVNGQGYLYATKEDKTLVFSGEYPSGTYPVEVPLDYVEGKPFAGWNLVGNPFAVSATLTQPYYRMNAEGTALNTETEETSVAAMEGVFVQATAANQTVTFTAQTRGGETSAVAALNICLSKVVEPVETPVNRGDGPSTSSGTSVLDNAIIRFDGGQTLEKFSFREGSTKLYIPQDGTDYAIACAESTGEMPVNFKAEENGTYTLTVSTTLNSQLSTLNYLHLIDNLTGADVDLLSPSLRAERSNPGQPASYTFTAKTTDYESRFKLVLAVGSSAGSDTFAFFSNGNLIVNGEGTLQVFDVLGHQLVTKQLSTLNSQLSTLNYKSGVYMLRLINGDKVRTQKIVVE